MKRAKAFASIQIERPVVEQELTDIGEIGDRVRIAQFGLARPVLAMRQAQLRKEAERVARRKGAGHPEARARAAAADRMQARNVTLARDLEGLRVEPPEVSAETGAGLYGRVVDLGAPRVRDLCSISARASGFTSSMKPLTASSSR